MTTQHSLSLSRQHNILSLSLPPDSDYIQHIAAVIREIILKYQEKLDLSQWLPNIPDVTNSPIFRQELINYVGGKEWTEYHEKQVREWIDK